MDREEPSVLQQSLRTRRASLSGSEIEMPSFCSFSFPENCTRDAGHNPAQAQVTCDMVESSTSLVRHLCRNKGDALVIGLVDLFEIDSVDVVGRRFGGHGGKQSESIF